MHNWVSGHRFKEICVYLLGRVVESPIVFSFV